MKTHMKSEVDTANKYLHAGVKGGVNGGVKDGRSRSRRPWPDIWPKEMGRPQAGASTELRCFGTSGANQL